VLPTLGAVDALTIVLAARHPELWPSMRRPVGVKGILDS